MKCQRCHKNIDKSGGVSLSIRKFESDGFVTGEVVLTFCHKCGEKILTGTTQHGSEKPIEKPSKE